MRFELRKNIIYDNYNKKYITKQDEIVEIMNELNEQNEMADLYTFNVKNYCIDKNGQFFSRINKKDIINIVDELNKQNCMIKQLKR